MELFSSGMLEYFMRLFVALMLGMVIGVERVFAHKTAGMRTYSLVAMGSALFVVISQMLYESIPNNVNLDPIRMASQIVVGLGFIGAGIIIFKDSHVTGLTSAAGLWVAGGIGVAAGYGMYEIAIFSTILTLFVFTVLWFIEQKLKKNIRDSV